MKPPIFIIGTQRSGTTLLCRILSVHPNIFIRNEIPAVTEIFQEKKDRAAILKDIDHAMEQSLGAGLLRFLNQYNKNRWGLKDPDLTHCLPTLHSVFLDAKVIFIVRDGRAVANSYIKNMQGLGANTYFGALRWRREVNLQDIYAQRHKKNAYIVRFEDLVADHVNELKKICQFLDEPYAEQLTNYFNYETVITKREQSRNVFKKPDIKLTQKWKKDLTPFQINVFENIAGDTLKKFGYELIGQQVHISMLLKLWFYLDQKTNGRIRSKWVFRNKQPQGQRL